MMVQSAKTLDHLALIFASGDKRHVESMCLSGANSAFVGHRFTRPEAGTTLNLTLRFELLKLEEIIKGKYVVVESLSEGPFSNVRCLMSRDGRPTLTSCMVENWKH